MAFTYDNKSTNSLTKDDRTRNSFLLKEDTLYLLLESGFKIVLSYIVDITLDNKSSTTLTNDSRSSAGVFTNDGRSFNYLWVATTFPWVEAFPWLISGDGQILLKDIRN